MKLFIPGIPFSKQSMRVARIGNFIRTYQPAKIIKAEQTVKAVVISQLPDGFKPFQGPIIVKSIVYTFPPLKGFSRAKMRSLEARNRIYKTTKPDLSDNLNKGLFDALEGVVYMNDSQICEIRNIRKVYGLCPGIEIEIEEV